MDRDGLARVRHFLRVADAILNAVPRPVPPRAPGNWDGLQLDVMPLYRVFDRLPAAIQASVARNYRACMDVLDHQTATASHAQSIRFRLFMDLMTATRLTPEQLVPDPAGARDHLTLVRPHDDDDDADDTDRQDADEQLIAAVGERVAQVVELFADGRDHTTPTKADPTEEIADATETVIEAQDEVVISSDQASDAWSGERPEQAARDDTADAARDEAADATRVMPHARRWAAAAGLVAAGCLATLAWLHVSGESEPAVTRASAQTSAPRGERTLPIARAVQLGDMTAVVCHARQTEDVTRLDIQWVNPAATSRQTTIAVRDADADPNAADTPPVHTLLPPQSTVHTVVEIPRRIDDDERLTLWFDEPTGHVDPEALGQESGGRVTLEFSNDSIREH